ncbi:MAG: trypsin-like peptidase domain-containing protein [Proteobacteria bacterium]|nr:trypsin-like peptidase domain-containing protein [Pseudomonadota bacterium]
MNHPFCVPVVAAVALATLVAPTPASAESLDFDRLVIQAEGGTNWAESEENVRTLMLDTMSDEGFDVPGASSSAFSEREGPGAASARFVVAGIWKEAECLSESSWGGCQVLVTWQLLDREIDEIVYQSTISALGEVRRSKDWEGGAVFEALVFTLRELLNRPAFLSAVGGEGATSIRPSPTVPITVPACEAGPGELPSDLDSAKAASVVVISGNNGGSGVIVSPAGYVLTAAHVVVGRRQVQLKTADGATLLADVVRMDLEADVALLHSGGRNNPCARLATTPAAAGSDVFAIGHPGGEELAFSVSRGVISGTRPEEARTLLQTDLSISPGYSGGGLWSTDGRVAGFISHKLVGDAVEGLGFATSAGSAIDALMIQWGPESESKPLALTPQRDLAEPFVDEGDRIMDALEVPGAVRRGQAQKKAGVALFNGGGGGVIAGLMTSLAGVALGTDEPYGDGPRGSDVRAAGVVILLLSGATMTSGVVLNEVGKKRVLSYVDGLEEHERERGVAAEARVGPGGVSLSFQF